MNAWMHECMNVWMYELSMVSINKSMNGQWIKKIHWFEGITKKLINEWMIECQK